MDENSGYLTNGKLERDSENATAVRNKLPFKIHSALPHNLTPFLAFDIKKDLCTFLDPLEKRKNKVTKAFERKKSLDSAMNDTLNGDMVSTEENPGTEDVKSILFNRLTQRFPA